MLIQILNKKLMGPSSPTPKHLRTLKISPLDVIAPPVYMAAVGFYPMPDITDLETSAKARKSLEASLSESLTLFYPFAGRYDGKNQTVDCNDQGVEYVEARVGCEMARVMYGKADAKLLDCLAPPGAEESATTPLMLIQLNVFDCGGVAVGIRFSHRLSDATTIINFLNAWANICTQGKKSVSPPNFDSGYIFPVKDKPWLKSHSPWKKEPTNLVTKRFVFNKSVISSLKAIASDVRISRVMAVTALLWRSFMRAREGADHGSLLTHIVNLRRRTHVPVPENICGNFWRCANTRCSKEERELGLEGLMRLLCASVRKAAAESGSAVGGDELMLQSAEALMELCEESERENGECRIFTSWCRFPLYEADFGWGRPRWVSSVHYPVRITVLIDSYDGEGIEAWVSLEDHEMDRLERDADFLAYTS